MSDAGDGLPFVQARNNARVLPAAQPPVQTAVSCWSTVLALHAEPMTSHNVHQIGVLTRYNVLTGAISSTFSQTQIDLKNCVLVLVVCALPKPQLVTTAKSRPSAHVCLCLQAGHGSLQRRRRRCRGGCRPHRPVCQLHLLHRLNALDAAADEAAA